MNYYWDLTLRDGTVVEIPPAGVDVVKRRMASGQTINTKTMSIPPNEIKSFRQTERIHTEQPLLEAAAAAFDSPVYNEDGDIKVRWVKKSVPADRYNRFYSASPGYRKLGNDNGMVVVAFRLPVHQIDINKVSYCSDDEIRQLTTLK